MALKIEIFLPKETTDNLTEEVQETILELGNLLGTSFGNEQPEDDFDLDSLNSFIIIRDENIPNPKKFEEEDMYFVIPIGE